MSVYRGNQIISYLSDKLKQSDPKSSSHWDKYHMNFEFSENNFSGIAGFGSNESEYHGIRKIAHSILQHPFRALGKNYIHFKRIDEIARTILEAQNKGYSLDVLRQVITLSFLNENNAVSGTTSCVIGEGFATMTSLLLNYNKQRVILVNLSKTLLVDIWYLKLLLRDQFEKIVFLVTDYADMDDVLNETEGKQSVVAIEAQYHTLIQGCPIDLTINIASMQEMNPAVIVEYFKDLEVASKRKDILFYCCNRDEKVLPDGTKVIYSDYPWDLCSKIIIDDLCPWHQKYYNIRPPFYHDYDGVIRHRLVKFSQS